MSHFPLRRLPDQPGATPAVFLSLPPPLPKPFHFQHSSSTNHRHLHFHLNIQSNFITTLHPSQWLELSKPQERYYPHHRHFRILLLTSSQSTGGKGQLTVTSSPHPITNKLFSPSQATCLQGCSQVCSLHRWCQEAPSLQAW